MDIIMLALTLLQLSPNAKIPFRPSASLSGAMLSAP
jgi:hypothetical protein